eukprot:CAMPEP_0172868878 /NCGR_PEP_ID=MMETSP1075-20121228/87516_1 /TAXON_ID=2916 /ORGANISM="Ceratium fusus, Strain PA161109" /LENGTH=215 /DNA_ID=CAMNT_0013718635 /DNA_START=51 /DNA_END=699 /DNA_ORIENTATION=+
MPRRLDGPGPGSYDVLGDFGRRSKSVTLKSGRTDSVEQEPLPGPGDYMPRHCTDKSPASCKFGLADRFGRPTKPHHKPRNPDYTPGPTDYTPRDPKITSERKSKVSDLEDHMGWMLTLQELQALVHIRQGWSQNRQEPQQQTLPVLRAGGWPRPLALLLATLMAPGLQHTNMRTKGERWSTSGHRQLRLGPLPELQQIMSGVKTNTTPLDLALTT